MPSTARSDQIRSTVHEPRPIPYENKSVTPRILRRKVAREAYPIESRYPQITSRAKAAEIGYKRNTGSVRQASAKRTPRKIRESNMRYLDERIGGVFVADRQAHPLRA